MRLSIHLLLLAASTTFTTLATPIPADFAEVEKRWAVGDSEVCLNANLPGCYLQSWIVSIWRGKQQIHSGLTHRDMTPAWPIARDSTTQETGFASATDFRSLEVAEQKRNPDPLVHLKSFVGRLIGTEGSSTVVTRDESAPVIRPRKAMRYYFTS